MKSPIAPLRPIPRLIFFSRWLQLPLYLGLIIAQAAYVYLFVVEVWHLVSHLGDLDETKIMLAVLGLIDVVMISNLLIMVIIGGTTSSFPSSASRAMKTSPSGWTTSTRGC